MLAFADHTFAKYSKVKRSTLINSKPFKKSAPKASQHSRPSGGKFIGSQTVMYKFLCECLANLPCPLSLSLCCTLRIQMYSCGKMWSRNVKSLLQWYFIYGGKANTQLHDVLRLLDPGHAFTNDCQNVQNDEQQHHLKIPTFFWLSVYSSLALANPSLLPDPPNQCLLLQEVHEFDLVRGILHEIYINKKGQQPGTKTPTNFHYTPG